jgi:hypothetical protein
VEERNGGRMGIHYAIIATIVVLSGVLALVMYTVD